MSAILASLRHPLIQAPMAFAHDTALPLAVCRAGALGSLAAAMYDPPALEQALQTMRDESDGLPLQPQFLRPPHTRSGRGATHRLAGRAAPLFRRTRSVGRRYSRQRRQAAV